MSAIDLSTVSRSKQREETMLQHPIYLYQVHTLGKHGAECINSDTGEDNEDSRDVLDCLDNWGMADQLWRTSLVFATYEEAHAYGMSNRHNDGEENAGWRAVAELPARPGWDCPSRPRDAGTVDQQEKIRWEIECQNLTHSHSGNRRTTGLWPLGYTMHFKNGRPAKNGDKVIMIDEHGTPFVGVLVDAQQGITHCNGSLIALSHTSYADLSKCLHVDDLKAFMKTVEEVPDTSNPVSA